MLNELKELDLLASDLIAFLFSREKLEGGQQETIVVIKNVPVDLNVKFISKFNHGFINRGCCTVLF